MRFIISVAVTALALVSTHAFADHDAGHDTHPVPERFGKIQFPTSCSAEVQPEFEHSVALLHSFAYPEAGKAFEQIAARDPGCAMAHWGAAMSWFHQIWSPPTPDEFKAGKAAAEKAVALAPKATPRERDYIAAIQAYYQGDDIAHPARVVAYEKAMTTVSQHHPDDHEAAIFHALSILAIAYNSPPDKTYTKQKQAAEILNRLLPLEPEHPGIAHYMIHSFDYPEVAGLALPAARAYVKIAPSAPHALHMPSHIFTRLGMWQESIDSNIASAKTAQSWMARSKPGATSYEALHAMDYLEYAYLQGGRDAEARAIVDSARAVLSLEAPAFQAGYALAAIPARFALETRAWKEAAALTPRPADFPWAKYTYAEAIVHFARAVGAARSGDLPTARQAVARLEAIRSGLAGQKGFDWATQIEIQRRAAAGWLARAEKKNEEAVKLMRDAADLEDRTDKHPVTPGSVLPAREQLADLLLEVGKPHEALTEYEESLRTAPARFNSYLGAARAAKAAGQTGRAEEYRAKLQALCGGSKPARLTAAGLVD
jgi:tetratricopeptide (TPR) repeat protein